MYNSTKKAQETKESTLNLPDTLRDHFFEELSGLNVFIHDYP